MPDVDPRDVAVLLPHLPTTYAIAGPPGHWPEVLGRWGCTPTSQDRAELCVVTGRAAPPAANAVVATRHRLARRALGARLVARYGLRRAADGSLELRPVARGWRVVVVAARGSARPGPLQASGVGRETLVRISTDPRRRVAMLTDDAVVKVPRDPGQGERGATEQAVLAELRRHGIAHVPDPLGAGDAGSVSWSAESLAAGSPLAGVDDPARARSVLAGLASWLGTIASRTRHAGAFDALPLRGPHGAAGSLHAELVGVSPVLHHGDLASGLNVLVDGDDFTVVDWETARRHGLPALDLVPLLGLGLARLRGVVGPEAESDVALRLLRGDEPESPWLFDQVRRYASAAGVPLDMLGRLAALAWAYQASMRLVHDELVLAAGGTPVRWTSSAEHVASAWLRDPRLGRSWPALTGRP